MLRTNQDDISVIDIIEFLKYNWKVILGATTLGGVIAFSVGSLMEPKFQASATIDIATVSTVAESGSIMLTVTSKPAELPVTLAEKMKIPTYYSQQTVKACGLEKHPNPLLQLSRNLKPGIQKGGTFVSISFEATSPEIAAQCLESVLDDVRKKQEILTKASIDAGKNALATFESRLTDIQRNLKQYPLENFKFDFNDPQFSASALLLNTLLTAQREANALENKISDARIALLEPQTKPASFIVPVYASNQQISPKRTLITLIGLLLGGAIALSFILLNKIFIKANTNRALSEN